MITHHLQRCLPILLIVLAVVTLGHCCPSACICQQIANDDVLIDCQMENDAGFIVEFKSSESKIKIQCTNSPKWSDFNVKAPMKKDWKILSFVMCDLPGERSLGDIARMIEATGIEKLYFQSYKDLSFTLKRHHLDGFQNLKELILSSNNATDVSNDLLSGLGNLTGLNLVENNLHLTKGFFDHTPALRYVELGNNNMRSIEVGMFEKLKNLTFLNLWSNGFVKLRSGSFDGLDALKTLGLNRNYLVTLPENIFANLSNLEVINLSRNNFTDLPTRLLQNNTKLKNVTLTDNRRNMTLPRGLFANLPQLKDLKLRRNGFLALPEDLIWGSSSLIILNLERNYLTSLPALMFRDSTELLELTLTFNDIEKLPDNIFSNTTKLAKLDLSKNRISYIFRHTFNGLSELRELNMEHNHLKIISKNSFSPAKNLRIIRLSDNHLKLKPTFFDEFGPNSPFAECDLLEELYLVNNNISLIFGDWILNPNLRILDLTYNNISSINFRDLQFLSKSIRVNLTHNNIKFIDLHEAEYLSQFQDTAHDEIIFVGNNPLHCGCNVYDLLRYLEGKIHPNVHNSFHITVENLTCQSPEDLKGVYVTDLKSNLLKCSVPTCPEGCVCYFKPEGNTFILDCSNKNLIEIPSNANITNDFGQYELNYTGNKLTTMPDVSRLKIGPVKNLSLSHNRISHVTLNGLPNTLEVLELDNNNISRLSHDVLEFLKNSSLTRLTLHDNPWQCDCEAKELFNFIIQRTEYVTIPNLSQMICYGKNISLLDINPVDLCLFDTTMIISCSTAISLFGLIIGALGLFYYKYQRQIKVWLFAHQWCLWFITEEELDKEKLYDAFVSYSHKDREFVEHELVSKLESGPTPFKLCLHYRDWLAGEWIPANIARSVEDSKRTIVVLSPNFLESVWGRMEFRAAHSQALSEGRARVILVLYGDIGPTDDLDPELKAYISMNTYVKWGDPWFWDKLRYALPHRTKQLSKISTTGKKIFENQSLYFQANGEKKELIFQIASTETSPTTTPPADTLKTFICDQEAEKKTSQLNGFSQNSGKMNGNVKIILSENSIILSPEQLIKISPVIDNRECMV